MARTMKRFTGAPFGSQSVRFEESPAHPKCKKNGLYTKVPYCEKAISELEKTYGPGLYNVATPDYVYCVPEKRFWGSDRQRETKSEESTQLTNLMFQQIGEKKRLLKMNMGPGKYKIKHFLELQEMRPSSVRGLCDSGEKRFREPYQFCVPGPGTYGNPYTVIEEKAKQSASSRGIMDSKAKKGHLFDTDCSLGPGTYNQRNMLDEFLNRVVSKRGPYETFTEDRSKPILYGYLAAPKRPTDPGPYEFASFVDDLSSNHKSKHGKFAEATRFPRLWTEGVPGPAAYNLRCFSADKKRNAVPFLVTAKRSLYFPNDNYVGVGRYNIAKQLLHKTTTCCKASFLSKTGRYLSNLEKDKCWRERIRATNIPLEAREFLVTPDKYLNIATQDAAGI
ncbi:lymphocyte expansion molecule [Rhinatrema bivittatum]|uniref:lymphocyte expansion molecule n=1 Tax=Rhinatrema bivittatum TaxID=194408 RepID=UPI00112C37DB|nr:lymphocyte expansion molecule [Rhinatrema bivittatum]